MKLQRFEVLLTTHSPRGDNVQVSLEAQAMADGPWVTWVDAARLLERVEKAEAKRDDAFTALRAEVEDLRRRDAERKGIIDAALCAEVERLRGMIIEHADGARERGETCHVCRGAALAEGEGGEED